MLALLERARNQRDARSDNEALTWAHNEALTWAHDELEAMRPERGGSGWAVP